MPAAGERRPADEQRPGTDAAEQLGAMPARDADAGPSSAGRRSRTRSGDQPLICCIHRIMKKKMAKIPAPMNSEPRSAPSSVRERNSRKSTSGSAARRCTSDEGGEQHGGQQERADGLRRAPAEVVALDQGVDQRDEPAGDEHRAGHVEAAGPLVPALRHEAQGPDDGEHGDRDVDEEHPAPGGVLGEHAAEDQAEGRAAGGDRCPDAERAVALPPSSKTTVSSDSAAGDISAPPRPCSARAAMSRPRLPASPPSSEATANSTAPTRKTLRRPSRSASLPPSSRKPPKVRV